MNERPILFEQVLGNTTTDKRIEILRAIHKTGSISEAARANGVSYKAAWQAVDTLSNLAGVPLIAKTVGGSGGGGAQLTKAGVQVMDAAEILSAARMDALARIRMTLDEDAALGAFAKDAVSRPGLRTLAGIGLRTSMRNQLPCEVIDIQIRQTDVRVSLVLADGQILVSRITRESLELLDLVRGTSALALFKATAVTVAPTIVGVGEINILKGSITRHARSPTDRQVTLALSEGLQLTGMASPDLASPLRRGHCAMAAIDSSSVVIGLMD